VLANTLTVFFLRSGDIAPGQDFGKIDRSMPIVAETKQTAGRRNSRLKSRAQVSDGSWSRFFEVHRKDLH
jgi:hypothetical protein